jgi:thymidylate synthase
MQTIWRSHDIAKGWPENLYGMLRLLRYVSEETGYKPGKLVSVSQSAHIYLSDFTWIDEVRKTQFANKIPRAVFDDKTEADPRGNVSISVVGKEIKLVIQDPKDASPLMEVSGTYKQIWAKLKHLDLFSDPGHLIDIGAELQKAELSRQLGFPYVQDKPTPFGNLNYRS